MTNIPAPEHIPERLITSAFGVLSPEQRAIIAGVICTVATIPVNWYYKRKEFQLKAGEYDECPESGY